MRFLIITKDLFTGGAERVAVSQANILHRAGHAIHLLSIEGTTARYEIDEGVRFNSLDFEYKRSKKTRFIEHKEVARKIENKYLSIESNYGKIDRVFIHYYPGFSRYLKEKERFVFWLHNPCQAVKINFINKLKNRRALSNGSLVAVSNFIKQTCLEFDYELFRKSSVIFNPFDKDEIRRMSKDKSEVPSCEYYIGCGRLNISHKGWDWLISAYKKASLSAKLVIVGEGEDKEAIQKIIMQEGLENVVILVGGKDNPYPWIKNAKCLIMPSYHEGFGNVLVESLILGTPVITSDCGGPRDIMVDELNHWMVPPGDVAALAMKIKEFDNAPYVVQDHHIAKYEVSSLVSDLESVAGAPDCNYKK